LTDFDKRSRIKAVELYAIIKAELNQMGRNYKEDICFSDFLNKFQTDHLGYITAIRSSIKRNTVFLQRSTNAIFVNDYNEDILSCWQANIAFQFVIDTYACAKYCVGYVLKCDGESLYKPKINSLLHVRRQVRDKSLHYLSNPNFSVLRVKL